MLWLLSKTVNIHFKWEIKQNVLNQTYFICLILLNYQFCLRFTKKYLHCMCACVCAIFENNGGCIRVVTTNTVYIILNNRKQFGLFDCTNRLSFIKWFLFFVSCMFLSSTLFKSKSLFPYLPLYINLAGRGLRSALDK